MKTILLSLSLLSMASAADVAYPEGYRNWKHVKSMVIGEKHPLYEAFGGIHHLYANAAALRGYSTGRFPDGAIIVFDLLEAKSDGGALVEGARKVTGVMVKNAARYRDTGGWGFEGFKGDSKTDRAVGANAAQACYACHTQQKQHGFVFSGLRK